LRRFLLDPPQVLAPPNDPPRVVVLARLVPEKCIATVLEAWADPRLAARPLELRILGDGPLRGELEARARALGLGARAEFLGSRADALAHLEGALALVSPDGSSRLASRRSRP
jgi:glycosyltransferase involved in cell wall biosynthesis